MWKVFARRDKTITIVLWSFRTRGLKIAENIIHVYKTVLTKTMKFVPLNYQQNISVNHGFMLTCFNICSSDFSSRSKVNSDEFSLKHCETISANTKGINFSWNLNSKVLVFLRKSICLMPCLFLVQCTWNLILYSNCFFRRKNSFWERYDRKRKWWMGRWERLNELWSRL